MTNFASYSPTSTDPGLDVMPVTPSDSIDLPKMARAIRCKPVTGAPGTLRVTTRAGEVRDTEIGAGELFMVQIVRVHATGTTATGLEAVV